MQTATDLADRLNNGADPHDALDALDIDPDAISTEHECLTLDDPDNDVIDLCDGTLVRRFAGTWTPIRYRGG